MTRTTTMGKIKIKSERCKGCQLCIISCPQRLIVQNNNLNKLGVRPVYFTPGDCTGCALCARVCPECCIEVYSTD